MVKGNSGSDRVNGLDDNVRTIEDAANRADAVIGHLRTNEFDPTGHLQDPVPFTQTVA